MGTIIDMSKYMSAETIERLESGSFKCPKVYSVRFEVTQDEQDNNCLEYFISNKVISESSRGRRVFKDHLMAIVLDLCCEDPAMIVELIDTLAPYFLLLDDDEDDEDY